jgi:hypothetical protein
MKKWQLLALVPVIITFVVALLFPNLFNQFTFNPAIDAVLLVIGLTACLVIAYLLCESKRVFLYIALAVIFGISADYVIDFVRQHSYPPASVGIAIIFLLLSATFFCMAAYKMFLELRNRFR